MSDRQDDSNNNSDKKSKRKVMNLTKNPAFNPSVFENTKQQAQFNEQRGRGHRKDLLSKQREPQAPNSTPITDPALLNQLSDDFGTPKVQVEGPEKQNEPEKQQEKPKKERRGTFGQVKFDDM